MNPEWSSYYPQGAEYQAYLVTLADKYELREHIRSEPRSRRCGGTPTPTSGRSTIDADGRHGISYARIVITAAGYLNRPRWPGIQGRESFAGRSIHSALWDSSLDLAGKKVAVIGAGCTAVQMVDACVDE